MAEKEQLSVSMTTVLTNYHATCYSAAKRAWDVFFCLRSRKFAFAREFDVLYVISMLLLPVAFHPLWLN